MKDSEFKKYTSQAKSGIKGEAFFEMIISTYAIPHQVSGSKDLGLDFICEWAYGDKPTGVLFGVQTKTFSKRSRLKNVSKGIENNNGLEKYEINHRLLNITSKTMNYWKGFGIPIFLFTIIEKDNLFDCFYRRYTAPLTKREVASDRFYFKVNNKNSFLAFADENKRTKGFARDLYFDYLRCQYSKGAIIPISAEGMGLNGFPSNAVFKDLYNDYKDKIKEAYSFTEKALSELEK